ncbi:MAG TPA: Ig-like domain-containing protein, partial [Jatrophihabitantaceae bacterium]|nr:Ig-like domain-containing protein [Jatrophihabitantaceae bacterium]
MRRAGATIVRVVAAFVTVLLVLVGVPAVSAWAGAPSTSSTRCGDEGTPTVIALQDSHFYIDTASTATLYSGYAGYTIRAGGSARSHLWLGYSGFTGDVLSLAASQSSSTPLPDLPSGGATTHYALLTATAPTTTPQTHTVTVYDGPPGSGTALCSRTFTYADVVDTIKALANKVTSVTAAPSPAFGTIGDAVTLTVTGNTGTLGAGPGNDPGVLDYTPNALQDFPANAWRLERTELTISPDGDAPPVTYVDRLFLTGASGPAREYTAHYVFRAIGPSSAAAQIKPIQYIASGTQVKHTDQGGAALYSLPAVSSEANISVTKALTSPTSAILASGGGTASYAVTLANAGTTAGTVDWVSDVMPDDSSYVAGSLKIDGRSVADPTISGQTLVVPGPFRVPALGTSTLTYSLLLGATPGTRSNSAVAHFGEVTFDTTRDVTSTAPATADVNVLGSAALGLVADAATTPAGSSVVVDVLANDTAPSGLPLHITALGTPSTGTVVLNADDTVTYNPAAGRSGTATVTYTAWDGYTSGTATVTITVSPVAVRDTYSTGKNTTLNATTVLTNDSCTSCTVSTTLVSGPAITSGSPGVVTMASNGTFTYVPASNATGTVTFTYRETDPVTHLTADGNVIINLADLAPDIATTPYNTAVVIDVRANDPGCSGGCKPQAGTAPTRGTVTYPTGSGTTVTYTPTSTLWGLDNFTYGITGSTGSATTPVTVLVGPPTSTLTTTY